MSARTLIRAVGVLAVLLVTASVVAPVAMAHVIAHATPTVSVWYNSLAAHAITAAHSLADSLSSHGPSVLAMFGPMMGLKQGKPKSELIRLTRPESRGPDELEFFPDVLWDTFPYVSGTTTGAVGFFAAPNADKTLSNMLLAGVLQANEWFEVAEIHFDLLIRPTVTVDRTGEYDDNVNFRLVSRATIAFQLRNKTYGPVPLALLRPLGAGKASVTGTLAATNLEQVGTYWDSVGWQFEKSQVIGPLQNFSCTIQLPAAVTLAFGNSNIRVGLRGVHYRPPA